jgi:phenylalanine-4-hydroxylase
MSYLDNRQVSFASSLATDLVFSDPVRTEEDKDVWCQLLKLLQDLQRSHHSSLHGDYISGLEHLNISIFRIPSLSNLNEMLSEVDWTAGYVNGMVDDRLYQEMLAARVFPVARHIRRKSSLLHSAAPDFVHDVIGHLPMLFSAQYRSLLNDWARRALEAPPEPCDAEVSSALAALIDEREKDCPNPVEVARKTKILKDLHQHQNASPSRAARFARFYTWAIEFGVISDSSDSLRIIGSAALSSLAEFNRVMTRETRLLSFIDHAINTPVDYSVVQDTLFVARDFSEYQRVLDSI